MNWDSSCATHQCHDSTTATAVDSSNMLEQTSLNRHAEMRLPPRYIKYARAKAAGWHCSCMKGNCQNDMVCTKPNKGLLHELRP